MANGIPIKRTKVQHRRNIGSRAAMASLLNTAYSTLLVQISGISIAENHRWSSSIQSVFLLGEFTCIPGKCTVIHLPENGIRLRIETDASPRRTLFPKSFGSTYHNIPHTRSPSPRPPLMDMYTSRHPSTSAIIRIRILIPTNTRLALPSPALMHHPPQPIRLRPN